VRVQSRHFPEYRRTLDALAGRGLLYPCFCTRGDIAAAIAAQHGAGAYLSGHLPRLPRAEAEARIIRGDRLCAAPRRRAGHGRDGPPRLHGPDPRPAPLHARGQGDVVLARKDVPVSYHLCVTHDDALQGVTLVTRGEDLLEATDIHRLLQALMGWPEPLYAHHALILGPDGKRLAKRDRAPTLRALREAGHTPEEVRGMAGLLILPRNPCASRPGPTRSPHIPGP
jgi:glutamyl-Q tRNA(Asp) synthetase